MNVQMRQYMRAKQTIANILGEVGDGLVRGRHIIWSPTLVQVVQMSPGMRKVWGSLMNEYGALLVPDVGEEQMLKIALGNIASEDTTLGNAQQVLKLYKTDVTPAEGDTAGSYTVSTFTGYANVDLLGTSWSVATVAGITTGSYAQQSFTSSADQTTENQYGYYVVGKVSTILYWAEKFSDGPYPISFNGDVVKITPKITLD